MTEVIIPVSVEQPAKIDQKDDQQPQTADVHEQPPSLATATVVVNGTGGAEEVAEVKQNGHGVNGTAKKEKVVEPPKDPKEDPAGWVDQQIKPAAHKVNHLVLDWVQKTAVDDEEQRQPLPGKFDQVTKNQFLGYLRDGVLLNKLANKLSPGSVETVHEGDAAATKENQTANLQGFINFLKDKAGLADDQIFSVDDMLEKGKAGYNAVFNTIFQLGLKANEQFAQQGIDLEKIVQEAAQTARFNFVQAIMNFFKRARPTTGKPKTVTENGAAAATTTETNGIADKVIEETAVIEEKHDEQPPALPTVPPPSEPVAAQ